MTFIELRFDENEEHEQFFIENVTKEFVVAILIYNKKEQFVVSINTFTMDQDLQSYVSKVLQCRGENVVYFTTVFPIYLKNKFNGKPYMEIDNDVFTCYEMDLALSDYLYYSGRIDLFEDDINRRKDFQYRIYVARDKAAVSNIGGPLELEIANHFAKKYHVPVTAK